MVLTHASCGTDAVEHEGVEALARTISMGKDIGTSSGA